MSGWICADVASFGSSSVTLTLRYCVRSLPLLADRLTSTSGISRKTTGLTGGASATAAASALPWPANKKWYAPPPMAPSPTSPPTAMMMSLSDSLRLAGAALPSSPSAPSGSDRVSLVLAIAPAPLRVRCAPGRQDGTQNNAAALGSAPEHGTVKGTLGCQWLTDTCGVPSGRKILPG